MVKSILRLEGLMVFGISIGFYWIHDFSWLWFFILLLAPDLGMVGYLINNKIGAILYNIFHTYSISLAWLILGLGMESDLFTMIGIIWTAHIAMDRMLGYGLKSSSHFKETHLNSFSS